MDSVTLKADPGTLKADPGACFEHHGETGGQATSGAGELRRMHACWR